MSFNIIPHQESKATRLMRHAILHELHCPPGCNDGPLADILQQVARALAQKAEQGDVAAIKELRVATFNARVETVTTKRFFCEPFKTSAA